MRFVKWLLIAIGWIALVIVLAFTAPASSRARPAYSTWHTSSAASEMSWCGRMKTKNSRGPHTGQMVLSHGMMQLPKG